MDLQGPERQELGQYLHLFKAMLSCKLRRQPMPDSLLISAKRLEIGVSFFDTIPISDKEKRVQWLEETAKSRAKAAGDPDWERKMKTMIETTEERQINRKLSNVTKGAHRSLDRIQNPVHDWFYSEKEQEIFHYDHGVWEAHPRKTPHHHFLYHTLKVLPDDATLITVSVDEDGIAIEEFLPKPQRLWKDITAQKEIEDLLLW